MFKYYFNPLLSYAIDWSVLKFGYIVVFPVSSNNDYLNKTKKKNVIFIFEIA